MPLFRRARFDFLDEDTSPFNLLTDRDLCRDDAPCPPIPLEIALDRRAPARTLGNSQARARECDDGAGGLVGVGVSRLRIVRRRGDRSRIRSCVGFFGGAAGAGAAAEPAASDRDVSALHDDRGRRRGGARRVGDSRRGGGVRRSHVSAVWRRSRRVAWAPVPASTKAMRSRPAGASSGKRATIASTWRC